MEYAKTVSTDLISFIDHSPSPWHVVATVRERLDAKQFIQLNEAEPWQLTPGDSYYVIRDDSSIIAFTLGQQPLEQNGFRLIGAHTDSPGLRLKPKAPYQKGSLHQLGVEVYGGPILATFTDRDLSLAGRLSYWDADSKAIESKLIRFKQPLVRLPNAAIHLNRDVNNKGLVLNKQTELPLVLGNFEAELPAPEKFQQILAEKAQIEGPFSFELNVYDTQPGNFFGLDEEFIADSQLDNLASCHAALLALTDEAAMQSGQTNICAFFDHEEVGSNSHKGADGSFLSDLLERIAGARQLSDENYKQALAQSILISADMAHAYHPNYPKFYDGEHKLVVNQGPAIKINVNQRYTSDSVSQALFEHLCHRAEIPFQTYSHRGDLPCGSTIGPTTAARLGIRAMDIGNPMWAMHSIRESAGSLDHGYMIALLTTFFSQH